jgi:hypothetical protein
MGIDPPTPEVLIELLHAQIDLDERRIENEERITQGRNLYDP